MDTETLAKTFPWIQRADETEFWQVIEAARHAQKPNSGGYIMFFSLGVPLDDYRPDQLLTAVRVERITTGTLMVVLYGKNAWIGRTTQYDEKQGCILTPQGLRFFNLDEAELFEVRTPPASGA